MPKLILSQKSYNGNCYENNHIIAVQEVMKFRKVKEVTKVMEVI